MSGGMVFVLVIIAIVTVGSIINNMIRAQHGYPVENDWGGKVTKELPDAERKIALLSSENEKLTGQVSRLEERIAVLERIATDPAERVAAEIEKLR